jgi:hypothetical protein
MIERVRVLAQIEPASTAIDEKENAARNHKRSLQVNGGVTAEAATSGDMQTVEPALCRHLCSRSTDTQQVSDATYST